MSLSFKPRKAAIATGTLLFLLALLIALTKPFPARAAFHPAATGTTADYPRVGLITSSSLAARSGPATTAKMITTFQQFRPDYLPTVLSALAGQPDKLGQLWLRVSLPGRPNGRYGWVNAKYVNSTPVYQRLLVELSSRTLSLYDHNKLHYRTRVAIGTPNNPTPQGNFYIQAAFHPTETVLGAYAFETSAYSPTLTDWPGGGIIGIHGWSDPTVFGKAVSHGCIRVSNNAARYLQTQLQTGTPITIRQ